jgi:hypothetical protein
MYYSTVESFVRELVSYIWLLRYEKYKYYAFSVICEGSIVHTWKTIAW